jgi:hypothetical protein
MVLLTLAAGSATVRASESKELERMKSLVGQWEGTSSPTDKAMGPVRIEYSVTAAGSAVVERLFPGTPHEMMSVYAVDDKGKLVMTHYCALGNHPQMTLKSAGPDKLELELAAQSNVDPKTMHMHGVAFAFDGPDHMTETWTSFDRGQKKETKVFDLKRKK